MEWAMATAEQLKALLKSYAEGDDDRFLSVSLQVASHAAHRGQGKLAEELRTLIEQARLRQGASKTQKPLPIAKATGELAGLLSASFPKVRLSEMVLAPATKEQLSQIIIEYHQQHKLRPHGLSARRKLLLIGPPGSGKTMTASTLAGELNVPLLGIQLHSVITKFMGETAAKLHLIFEAMQRTRGVYLFDEFDALGASRDQTNDVGEMRRVLNSFLQFLEQDDSDSIIIAATNHVGKLDSALFRRFDVVVKYELPSRELASKLIKNRLGVFAIEGLDWQVVLESAKGLSYAEIARACDDAARRAILSDSTEIQTQYLTTALRDRRGINDL
jgi:SpoVK/Ycf46/Vps4 family AAA+-type ATPase